MAQPTQDFITFGIVEDELIESEAMEHFITAMFPQAQVIWREEDGKSGLQAIHCKKPDILIVDIQMPVMDGLELCEKLYQEQYNGVILINTAYDKFSYAKRAIYLKAFDYIVKPVNNDELYSTLERCIEEAQRRSQQQRQQVDFADILQDISQYAVTFLSNEPRNESDSPQLLEMVGWPAQNEIQTHVMHILAKTPYTTDQIRAFENLRQAAGTNFLIAANYINDKHLLMITQPRKATRLSHLYTMVWCFGLLLLQTGENAVLQISPLCESRSAIALECRTFYPIPEKLPEHISQRITIPPRTWRIIRKSESQKYRNKLERYFRDGLFKRTSDEIQKIAVIHEADTDDVLWEAVQLILDAALIVWPNTDYKDWIMPLMQADIYLPDWFDQLVEFLKKLPRQENSDAIDTVIKLMETSFSQDITQTYVAEKLGLDSAYFSRLFKKRTGRNFSDMLIDIRMQHAEKMLLENPKVSLEELCKCCGLTSKTYFSEVFKKWKGMTITQFLKLHS